MHSRRMAARLQKTLSCHCAMLGLAAAPDGLLPHGALLAFTAACISSQFKHVKHSLLPSFGK